MKQWLICLLVATQALLLLAGCDNTSHPQDPGQPVNPIVSLQVTPANLQLPIGLSQDLVATAFYADGSSRDVSQQALWSSDAESQVSLGTATALGEPVTALAEGEARVTALFDGMSDVATIKVTNATVTDLRVSPASAAVPKGFSQQLQAIVTLSDGSTLDVTNNPALSWNSADPAIATVDSQGLAQAIEAGNTSIKASGSANGVNFEGQSALTVTHHTLTKLTLTPASATLAAGFQLQLQAIATFSDGSTLDVTDNSALSWASADPAIATVTDLGLAQGVSAGATELQASGSVNGASFSATSALTVTNATLADIVITPKVSKVTLGESQQYKALGSFSDGHQQDLSHQVQWQSADETVATMGLTGRAHTHATGTTQITASRAGVTSNSAELAAINTQVTTWGGEFFGADSSAVQPLTQVSSLVATPYNNASAFAALKSDGTVVTWGYGPYGGDSSAVQDQLVGVTAVTPGTLALAALRDDGSVVSWGDAANGGDSSAVQDKLSQVSEIFANQGAFAALKQDGTVVTWGNQSSGGDSSAVQAELTQVATIEGNNSAFAALKQDGTLVTWGEPSNGGNSQAVQAQLIDVKTLFHGAFTFAALRQDGTVVTWGDATSGGDSSAVQSQLTDVTDIVSTGSAYAALKQDGSVVSWGDATKGGDSSAVQAQLIDVKQIVANDNAFAALKQDGTIVTWGDAAKGGDSSAVQSQLTVVSAVSATDTAFAALKQDGTVVTWGNQSSGGDSSAVQSQLLDVATIYATGTAFAAVTSDGHVVSWGDAANGGDSSAVQSALSRVQSIVPNNGAFAAISERP
jgi:alpha-tubulin suppressor-like RCC1 family protein/uncharacterized protein YjdB